MAITSVVEFVALEPSEKYDTIIYKDKGKEWKKRLWHPEMRAFAAELHKTQQIKAVFEKVDKYFEIKSLSFPEDEETPTATPTHTPLPKETDWDMIGRQKARCSILQAAVAACVVTGAVSVEDIVNVAQGLESYVFSPMPSSNTTMPKKAPETDVVYANNAQIANLKKYVKSKNDADLLIMAEGRVGRDLASLEELTINEADQWLNEVVKKK